MHYNRPPEDPAFLQVIPEEMVQEMIEELWDRKERIEMWLTDPLWDGDNDSVQKELAGIDEALGLRTDGSVIHTGDALTDYWIERHLSGEITQEDLEMTPDDLKRKRRNR